jgi:hypothetical protein
VNGNASEFDDDRREKRDENDIDRQSIEDGTEQLINDGSIR